MFVVPGEPAAAAISGEGSLDHPSAREPPVFPVTRNEDRARSRADSQSSMPCSRDWLATRIAWIEQGVLRGFSRRAHGLLAPSCRDGARRPASWCGNAGGERG